MDSKYESRIWMTVIIAFFTTIVSIVAINVLSDYSFRCMAFEKGYEQVMVTGYGGPVWQKSLIGEM
jgi:hypothetical protein